MFATRRSSAITVAAVALACALAGTAIAGPEALIEKISKSKVKTIAKKQANRVLDQRQGSLNVNSAKIADSAKTADSARPTGPAGGDLNGTFPNPTIGDKKVTSDKLAGAAVTEAKIADDAVTSGKIASEQVHASELGVIQVVSANSAVVANGATASATASCPPGSDILSGGFEGGGDSAAWRVHRSSALGNGWHVFGTNQTGGNSFIEALAYCLLGP